MNDFKPFDPLKAKSLADTEVAALAQKREIKNILSSYVGWYDPFCELIQNSLDSVESRARENETGYCPSLWITINIQDNSLVVTDNGVGLDEQKFSQFLCPDISFKSGNTRGKKGVGATYLAYGFNYIQVSTKAPGFKSIGVMEGARKWLDDENPPGNPQMRPDANATVDDSFQTVDRGVSIYLKFDQNTHPKDLRWIISDTATAWHKILSVKTGLGAFTPNLNILVNLKVIDRHGTVTEVSKKGVEYFWPHQAVSKSATYADIIAARDDLHRRLRDPNDLPNRFKNLDAFHQKWSTIEIEELVQLGRITLDSDQMDVLHKFQPEVYVCYVYSLKIWDAINESLQYRAGQRVLYGGIQIAANNMPQGEIFQIPLNRNIGRQNQIHCVIHFSNCTPDLGRKGFQSEIVDFAKELAKKLSDGPLIKMKNTLRVNTGGAPNLQREQLVENWKEEMIRYESESPLELISKHFFLPANKISITSQPSREQDVIALFNQLLAGGVIRGIRIMSTNERLTYDGLYRIVIEPPNEHHIYHKDTNPLGVEKSIIDGYPSPFRSSPKVVEYKYSLDGLIEDIDNGVKNSNDISLVVVWETGVEFKGNYKISSFLDPDNLNLREYHGVTHTITNVNTNQREMDLIVLSELISFLNNQEMTIDVQRAKYEE
jgi:hypothetical protein